MLLRSSLSGSLIYFLASVIHSQLSFLPALLCSSFLPALFFFLHRKATSTHTRLTSSSSLSHQRSTVAWRSVWSRGRSATIRSQLPQPSTTTAGCHGRPASTTTTTPGHLQRTATRSIYRSGLWSFLMTQLRCISVLHYLPGFADLYIK